METEILSKIHQLYRSHIVTFIILLILAIIAIFITVYVIKNGIVNSAKAKIGLTLTISICALLLIVVQTVALIPVFKDYHSSSYIVLDDASIVIEEGSVGILDRINYVNVNTDNAVLKLKINSNHHLDTGRQYKGTIVYSKHSEYIIWYSLDNS